MRLRKHYIQHGETLQSISQIYFNTPEHWIELIEHNNLKYPYIVETSEEKKERPEDLVTYGDYLVIPVQGDLNNLQAQEINTRDRENILDLSLGRDFNITNDEDTLRGTSDEILFFKDNGQRDLSTVTGIENLKQQLQARLLTRRGSLLLHPNYGSDLDELFELNTPEQGMKIQNEIERTLLSDSRVNEVTIDNWYIKGNTFEGRFEINIISVDQALTFVLGADESGTFARFE